MINYLKGQVKIIDEDKIIVINQGVGYGVFVSNHILARTQDNDDIELLIYPHIRDDAFDLYGFEHIQSLKLFEIIIGISGIGPKTALNIMDRDASKIVEAVQNADINFFKAVPRIGKKMAQKIIIELKGKLGSFKELDLTPLSQKEKDVCDALTSLGFETSAVNQSIKELDIDNFEIQDAIKKIIKKLSQ